MRPLFCSVTVALAVTSSGCSGSTVVVAPAGPSAAAPVAVTISQPSHSPEAAFRGFGCQIGSVITAPFDVVVVATATVDMQHVTLRLLDGSHVGGPAITFPHAELTNQFHATVIVGGTTRVFRLQPVVACDASPWRAASDDIAFLDRSGAVHVVTTTSALQ